MDAGLPQQRRGVHERERRGARPRRIVEGEIRDQAGRVGQQVADGYALLVRSAEFGKVALHRGVETEPALMHEDHAGGRETDHLGERGKIVDGRRGHRAGVVPGIVPDRGEQGEPPVSSDRDHGARERAVHLGAQVVGDGGEPGAVEAQRHRRRQRYPGAVQCGGGGGGGGGPRREEPGGGGPGAPPRRRPGGGGGGRPAKGGVAPPTPPPGGGGGGGGGRRRPAG